MKKNKINIGILTFHFSKYNYGAVLQTYSTYKTVESLGYKANIINYEPKTGSFKEKVWNFIMTFLGYNFLLFRKKNLPNILKKTQNSTELKELNYYIDGFIVGSDQVWRYIDNTEALYRYFFDFVDEDKIKVSYAASFGVDDWPTNNTVVTKNIKNLLSRFDSISVREDSGVSICNHVFNVKAIQVLDPTLLADKNIFDDLLKNQTINRNKILSYMMLHNNLNYEYYFKKLAKDNKLNFKRVQGKKIYPKKMMFLFNSVSKWLAYLRDAEFIVTDSFHCVCFAIIFNKKFIVISNPVTGVTRLKSLLKLIKQEHRFYTDINKIPENILNIDIDYEIVDSIIKLEKINSLEFLKKALSKIHKK